MAKRRFSSDSQDVFDRIQTKIAQIDGKLLNKKDTIDTTTLINLKTQLRERAKTLKREYYAASSKALIAEAQQLLEYLKGYDGAKLRKI